MNAPGKEKSGRAKVKKPYQSPRLKVYGDLKTMTTTITTKGGKKGDGAFAATRL